MTSNYILCKYHDAIEDPPKCAWEGVIRRKDGHVVTASYWERHGNWRFRDIDIEPGDQWLEVTNIDAMSVESAISVEDYEYSRGREFFAKQILSEIDSGWTVQEIAKTCLGEIRRCHRAEIDKEREREGLPPVDWSTVP